MELKELDTKLLEYLYHNYNEPLSKIAKATKLSRDQVEYRLNKYLKEGIIRKFFPIVNYNKLGYNLFVNLLLKFEKPKMSESFSHSLIKNKNCLSYGKAYGKYDLFLNAVFKDEAELSHFLSDLFEDENHLFTDYLLIRPYLIELYPLKFIKSFKKEDYVLLSNKEEDVRLDKKDIDILRVISENGREKLIDLATKTNLSIETTLYRLRRLKSKKVILGNRIQFDISSLNYFYTLLLINFRNFSRKNKEKIKMHVRSSKLTNSLIFNLQRPNCIVQLFHKEVEEVREAVEKIRKLFENDSIEIEILQIGDDEIEVRPLPFITRKDSTKGALPKA